MDKLASVHALSSVAIPSTVPLKHRSNCPSAMQFYLHLKTIEDFTPISISMIEEGVCRSTERANELIDAWLQWFAAGATNVTKSHVMLSGPIDRTFHQMILNTTWYFRFCTEHTGVYTHHDPLTEDQRVAQEILVAVKGTIERLRIAFGDTLHPELKRWERQFNTGKITVRSVSCTGNNGPFIVARCD